MMEIYSYYSLESQGILKTLRYTNPNYILIVVFFSEKTKLGECPELVPEPRRCLKLKNGTCTSDSHCPDDLHCCPSLICGSLCTFVDIDSLPKPNELPTSIFQNVLCLEFALFIIT